MNQQDPLNEFFYSGKLPCNDAVTWVRYYQLYELASADQYWASLYFVVMTVLGIGYGDIAPITIGERMFVIVMMVSGSIFYGFILAGIAHFAHSRAEDGAKLQEVADWLDYRKVPRSLRHKINRHFQYTITMVSAHNEYQSLCEKWPRFLRYQVTNVVYPNFMRILSLSLFRRDSEQAVDIGYDVVRELVGAIRAQQLVLGDVLVEQGDVCEETFFVSSGVVACVIDDVTKHHFLVVRKAQKEGKAVGKQFLSAGLRGQTIENLERAMTAPAAASTKRTGRNASTTEHVDDEDEVSPIAEMLVGDSAPDLMEATLVALHGDGEFFPHRFDLPVERISGFSYVVQSRNVELVAVPTNAIMETFNKYRKQAFFVARTHGERVQSRIVDCLLSKVYEGWKFDILLRGIPTAVSTNIKCRSFAGAGLFVKIFSGGRGRE